MTVPPRVEKSFAKVAAFILAVLIALVCPQIQAQTVNVWLTTDDQSVKLQPQASVTFDVGTSGTNPVVVDETQTYQQIEGFGASMTDSAAYLLNEIATASARSNAMFRLFTRSGSGIGISFLRNPMGASDIARYHYSYDDLPPGTTDTNLTYFSIAHDQADIIPLLQQALQLNPQLKLMANPWSPPGWMKDSGSMIGGALLPGMYGPFANYFVKYIQAYQALGLPTHYVSLQNEPLYVPGDYPGMSLDAATQLTVLRDYVLPAFASNQITTKVLVYDHNWDRPDYPQTVFTDPTVVASSQVAGTAWHGYGGTPGAMLTLANQFPAKGNYETEHSGGTWVSDQVRSDFEEIIHVMRSWGRSYVKWSLALDQNHGPNAGGCNTCNPLVTVSTNTGAVSNAIEFYTLGHFSKFVLPGAYRIYSANAAGVVSAAFLNPDGSKALVAFNDTPGTQVFQVQWGNRSFSYSLAGYSGATFTWTGTQTGTGTLNPANQIPASSFNSVFGLQTEPTSDTLGGYDLGYANGGDYAAYQNVDFGLGFTNVNLRAASAGSGGNLQFRLDGLDGPIIGVLAVPVTGGWQTWQTVTGSVSGASGLHNLYLVLQGGSGIGNLNWFQFSGAIPAALALPAPWVSADIGTVGYAGSATFSGGIFTVAGSGADIENNADEFRFVYQPVSGICEVRARLASIQNTDPWAKAGVILRETTASGAINAAVFVTPGNGVTFQRRTSTGGTTASTVVSGITAPRWVRLSRNGNNFSAYYSSDGNTWTQLGSTASIAMNASAFAGLAVTAHNDTTNCAASFDNVSVNQSPVLAPIAAQTILAGRTLSLTNSATDADIPAQTLTFSLLNAPADAVISTNSGLFTWRPPVANSPTTQAVTVVVSDNGVPNLSATQSFAISVTRPVPPAIRSLSITNGQFGFWIYGDAGPDYTVQTSTNLSNWSSLATWSSPALPFFWSDTNSVSRPGRFYRAVLGP